MTRRTELRALWAVVIPAGLLIALYALMSAAPAQASSIFLSDRAAPPGQPATDVITLDVPILMYHHVGANFRSRYNISVRDFDAQMAYLAQHGYTTVSIDQIAAALRGQGGLPPCPVALTFDDGYADVHTNALPILKHDGLHATFYIVAGFISTTNRFMNWNQVKDLAAQGMFIGSHSYTHPFLAQLAGPRLPHQIVDSKTRLEQELGIPITTFAYPFGSFSLTAMRAVSEAGYTAAVWTGYGARQTSNLIYKLSRFGMYDGLSLPMFAVRLPRHSPDGAGACPLYGEVPSVPLEPPHRRPTPPPARTFPDSPNRFRAVVTSS